MISSIQQYEFHEGGRITLKGRPDVTLDLVDQQGLAEARAIDKELGLPIHYEQWAEIAKPAGMSTRRIEFIVTDESVTNLKGNPRNQPQRIELPEACYLEFGHRSFLVGLVTSLVLFPAGIRDAFADMGLHIPPYVEGDCILGEATLFNSVLARKAWEGIERGVFTHVCPLIFRDPDAPIGTGKLVEVSLTGDYVGCRNARILKAWEV
jgi:hypothetical protein